MSQTSSIQTVGREDAFPENVAGAYYVNTDCIICSLCSELAPEVFRTTEDDDHNYVFAQPVTREQLDAADEAIEACPVEAIIKDELEDSTIS